MTTVETLRTRLDKLQWDANQLETENRWLREENPEASRVLTLEAALKRSEDETARLRDQITKETTKVGEDDHELSEQLKTQKETISELREALTRSENRESELMNSIERETAKLKCFQVEEEQRKESRELQHYRALEAERVKWEA